MNFSQQNIILNMEKNYRKLFFPNASIIIFFVNDGADFDPNPHDVLPSKNSALLPPCS